MLMFPSIFQLTYDNTTARVFQNIQFISNSDDSFSFI